MNLIDSFRISLSQENRITFNFQCSAISTSLIVSYLNRTVEVLTKILLFSLKESYLSLNSNYKQIFLNISLITTSTTHTEWICCTVDILYIINALNFTCALCTDDDNF